MSLLEGSGLRLTRSIKLGSNLPCPWKLKPPPFTLRPFVPSAFFCTPPTQIWGLFLLAAVFVPSFCFEAGAFGFRHAKSKRLFSQERRSPRVTWWFLRVRVSLFFSPPPFRTPTVIRPEILFSEHFPGPYWFPPPLLTGSSCLVGALLSPSKQHSCYSSSPVLALFQSVPIPRDVRGPFFYLDVGLFPCSITARSLDSRFLLASLDRSVRPFWRVLVSPFFFFFFLFFF